MPPFRNPFQRKPPPTLNGSIITVDDSPLAANGQLQSPLERRPSYGVSRASSAISITKPKEPDEFKLSVVNDSGVYLPPSPPEKKAFWRRTPTSTTTSSHRSMLSENEPFSISRESFESYRRSFDISAKSPVTHSDSFPGRQSLDSRAPRASRPSLSGLARNEPQLVVDEEDDAFEDVGLNDEPAKPPAASKKKGLFSRFANPDTAEHSADDGSRPGSSHGRFHLPGRKRGQSGQGAELGSIPQRGSPSPAATAAIAPPPAKAIGRKSATSTPVPAAAAAVAPPPPPPPDGELENESSAEPPGAPATAATAGVAPPSKELEGGGVAVDVN